MRRRQLLNYLSRFRRQIVRIFKEEINFNERDLQRNSQSKFKLEFDVTQVDKILFKSFAYDKNNHFTLPQNASREVDNVYPHVLIQCESEDDHTHQRTNIHSYRRPPVNSCFLRYFNRIHLFPSNKLR